jgi:hypothetical protein
VKNINPSANITRRGRFYLSLGCLGFFGGAISIALGVLFIFVPLWDSAAFDLLEIFLFLMGFIAFMIGLAGIVRALTLKKDNELAYAVGEGLTHALADDNRYTYLRNVSKRGVGYIDAVLVGPPGALVFRIVDYSGSWINEHADWRVEDKGRLRAAKSNPTREVVRDVYALRKFLAKHRLGQVPVYAIVVFASPDIKLKAEGPTVPICEIPTLLPIMRRDYLTDERITGPAIKATVDAIIDG